MRALQVGHVFLLRSTRGFNTNTASCEECDVVFQIPEANPEP